MNLEKLYAASRRPYAVFSKRGLVKEFSVKQFSVKTLQPDAQVIIRLPL